MLFSSMSFIFVFLPIVLFFYWLVRTQYRNMVLLCASIFFYAWGEPHYLGVMLSTILVNYLGAIAIRKYNNKRKIILALTVTANLSFLFVFKYVNFFLENFNILLHGNVSFLDIVMPIGISFYTFQAISYVVDVYRGEVHAQKNIYKLSLYICLFPQLIAGPIVKYHDVASQIDRREEDWAMLVMGIKRFIIGLSKKVLIANTLGGIADKIFVQEADTFSSAIAWLGAVSYSLQLYFDFSGYSDMAIGLGLMFGFRFKENFNYPYISKSITEFWRRWHISLSSWFKEYLYIPLGGNRKSKKRTYLNIGIVFLLTGFWHGASWNFIVWGLWHGFFNILEKSTGWSKESRKIGVNFIKHFYAIMVFMLGWVMFRADNMEYAWLYIKNMFGCVSIHNIIFENSYYFDYWEIGILGIAVLLSTPIFPQIYSIPQKKQFCCYAANLLLLVMFITCVSFLSSSTYNPFIYFRF